MEGNLRFKIDWASFLVGRKFTVFALFYFVFEGNFPSTSPRGAYIWRGLYMEGLIFGILRYITLYLRIAQTSAFKQFFLLATKLPANLAAAEGVVHSRDTRCSSLKTSIFSIFQLIRSFFLEIKRQQPSRRIFVHGFCSLFLKPDVEGCHNMFNQSIQSLERF